jgi:hypothetical protein
MCNKARESESAKPIKADIPVEHKFARQSFGQSRFEYMHLNVTRDLREGLDQSMGSSPSREMQQEKGGEARRKPTFLLRKDIQAHNYQRLSRIYRTPPR